jgi:hypothetical protein
MQVELDKVVRGATKAFHMHDLLGKELHGMKAALKKLNKKKTRKRKYVQHSRVMTMEAGSQAGAEARGEVVGEEEASAKRVRAEGAMHSVRYCGACGQPGHNKRTCMAEVLDSDNSE